MKRIALVLLSVLMLITMSFTSFANAETEKTAYVNVSVATLWTQPRIDRPIDQPAVTNPVDMWKWTRSMTLQDKLDLSGKNMLETQALYGMKVIILQEDGDWVKVAVPEQPTPRLQTGYPGWMPKIQLTDDTRLDDFQRKPFIMVTSPTAWLYNGKAMNEQFMEISFNTKLPVMKEAGDEVLVATPNDGNKWIKKSDVAIYQSMSDIPKPTGEDLVNTAKKFLGLPYLWAGVSGFGFDCSGFTHTIFKANGIIIPRDSGPQSRSGTPVSKDELQPGDLMFFAYKQGKGSVHHVSMYIGDGKMIHSPNSARNVEIVSIDEPAYAVEFAGARRYLLPN